MLVFNLMQKISFYILFSFCLIFTLGGAFNEGFSRFFFAIPFYIAFFIIIKKFQAKSIFKKIAIATIAFSLSWNLTLTQNPLMYPILSGGTIEVLDDGYIQTYSDKSAGFQKTTKEEISCIGCGEVTYHQVLKGEVILVEGIKLNHPDFGLRRSLITKYGYLEVDDTNFRLSHTVVSPLHQLGMLMIYPALLINLKTMLFS